MKSLLVVFYGMLLGIANIIPGVSGGTMAVSLGIYDRLIQSISHVRTQLKQSLRFLVPLLGGAGLGIVLFSYSIEYLLTQFPLGTSLAFLGLILGGIPLIANEFKQSLVKKNDRPGVKHLLIFAAFFALIIWMSFYQATAVGAKDGVFSVIEAVKLFVIGVIGASAMVIPGVSGSLIFMISGYYYSILAWLNQFFSGLRVLDFGAMIHSASFLVPFGIGVLVGIGLISQVMTYLFDRFPALTYSGILGLVVASPIAVFKNTGALAGFNFGAQGTELFVGLGLFVLLFVVTYRLGRLEEKDVSVS